MSWSDVIEFPAVDATAAVKAAWIAAAEAAGDWWDTGLEVPRLEVVDGPAPGLVLDALAACRVADVALPDVADADNAGVALPGVADLVGELADVAVADATHVADSASLDWVDPEPGLVPASLGRWVRREWWSAPVRAQVTRF